MPDSAESGPREGLILLLFTLLTLAASGFLLAGEESDAVDDPVKKAQRGEVTGLGELSLLREENLRRALDTIERSSYPLVESLLVSADRISAAVRNRDGIRRRLTFDPGFGTQESDLGTSTDNAVRAGEIDAGGPERMVREVVRRLGVPAEAVEYVNASYSNSAAGSRWLMSVTQGPAGEQQWVADPDGGELRKPGELSRADKRAIERRAACRRKAAGRGAEAARECAR